MADGSGEHSPVPSASPRNIIKRYVIDYSQNTLVQVSRSGDAVNER